MATFDYARAKATADRLIAKFGTSGTIRRTSPGAGPAYNPGSPATTDYACRVAVTDYSTYERQNTQIQSGDRRIYVSAQGLAISPIPSDQIVIGSETYRVVDVDTLRPADVAVYFECQARR